MAYDYSVAHSDKRAYKKPMEIEFDPAKDASNIAKHGVSLARAADLDIVEFVDDSYLYDEPRYRLFGWIDGIGHCVAAVDRGTVVRVISLRRVTKQERRRYDL